jgi:hypothetical protein
MFIFMPCSEMSKSNNFICIPCSEMSRSNKFIFMTLTSHRFQISRFYWYTQTQTCATWGHTSTYIQIQITEWVSRQAYVFMSTGNLGTLFFRQNAGKSKLYPDLHKVNYLFTLCLFKVNTNIEIRIIIFNFKLYFGIASYKSVGQL